MADDERNGISVAPRRHVPSEELRRQHLALKARISRLREALAAPRPAREPVAEAVGALLPELFQHESREAARLAPLLAARSPRLQAQVESEHLALRSLARDLQVVLENPKLYPLDHLARLSRRLGDAVLEHLAFEERMVLPPAR